MENQSIQTNVLSEASTVEDHKVFLNEMHPNQRGSDGSSVPAFQESRAMSNIDCCEQLLPPIHGPNKAAYPEYGS
ncbi:MAG: hypothetical protein ABIQ77_10110, partial [Anaerolineales bacterium]